MFDKTSNILLAKLSNKNLYIAEMLELETKEYIPRGSHEFIQKWLPQQGVRIKVKNNRSSKLGDYKKLKNGHQITINGDLNPDFFLLTLTHEIAHLVAFEKYGRKIKPHGAEWKNTFSEMLKESLQFYSEKFAEIIVDYKQNPKANLFSHHAMADAYNEMKHSGKPQIEALEDQAVFRIGKRVFKRGVKRKIRYLCTDLSNGKKYLIHGKAPVDEIIN